MAKKIIWTQTAQTDRKQIFEYWNLRNKSNLYSSKLNELFNSYIKSLAIHPKIGFLTEYKNIRAITVKDYQIFYLSDIDCITIITIWDSRQNPNRLKQVINET